MRFGMILLGGIIVCSLAGSLIPQGDSPMTYVRAYGATTAKFFINLGFTDIFHTWYFCTLEILLCGNLILCSIIRFPKTRKMFREMKRCAAETEIAETLQPGQAEKIRQALKRSGFRQEGEVWSRNGIGAYGSFLTHMSILVILGFGSLVLMTPKITDQTIMPGESIRLEDGTVLTCLSFHIEDADGKLDYASLLRAENAERHEYREQEIRVNEPMRIGDIKIYQQTYGTAGQVLIHNDTNGAEETVWLTEPCFLSIDSRNGVYFEALYPGFIREKDGSYTLITATDMGYSNPVYSVKSISDGASASVLAFPWETMQIGTIRFTFMEPTEYPGLRIKHVSMALYAGLYFGFGLMIAALYLCFFRAPVCVRVNEEGYGIRSPKPQEGLRIRIETALGEE